MSSYFTTIIKLHFFENISFQNLVVQQQERLNLVHKLLEEQSIMVQQLNQVVFVARAPSGLVSLLPI